MASAPTLQELPTVVTTETDQQAAGVSTSSVSRNPTREQFDLTITDNRLTCYVPSLSGYDDEFRLRVILHDFGLVWQHASDTERLVLVAEEPALFEPRWDAFLAAYVEHLCYHSGLEAPDWVKHSSRYTKQMWWPGNPFEFERGSIMLKTPAAFEVHGMWIDERELQVV